MPLCFIQGAVGFTVKHGPVFHARSKIGHTNTQGHGRFAFELRLYGFAKPIRKLPGHVTGLIRQNDGEFVTTEAGDMIRAASEATQRG